MLVEDYLDRACAPLIPSVPYARRRELRAEWRQHLSALIEAYVELGHPRRRAAEKAIRQFGDPRTVAKDWVREWSAPPPDSLLSPAKVALASYTALAGLSLAGLKGMMPGGINGGSALAIPPEVALVTILLLTPAAAGFLMGLLLRGRSVLGSFFGLALTCLLTLTISGIVSPLWDPGGLFAGFQFVLWMPIGCASAAVGQLVRRGVPRLVRRLAD